MQTVKASLLGSALAFSVLGGGHAITQSVGKIQISTSKPARLEIVDQLAIGWVDLLRLARKHTG